MIQFEVDVKDLERLQKSTEDVARRLASGSLVAKAALVIERQAKINATGRPGPKVQTGRLRASITTEVIDSYSARVGTNVFYAPFVEFGHKQHIGQFVPPLKKRLVNSFAPAYPFIQPTIEQTKGELGDVMVSFAVDISGDWDGA